MVPGCPAESGSATVLAVGLIVVIVTVLLGALAVLSAVASTHRAAVAADLAALAAAGALGDGSGPADACAAAGRIAASNRAALASCEVGGQEVTVRVTVRATWPGLPDAAAQARAGPPRGSRLP